MIYLQLYNIKKMKESFDMWADNQSIVVIKGDQRN
jgi:hypothetical protein